MRKAAILVRVSTSRQDYLSQIGILQSVARNKGFTVDDDDIYAEKITGRKQLLEDRVQLDRLMNDLSTKQKKFDTIFASEVSRLSRNPKLGREIYETLCDLRVPMFISSLNISTLEVDGTRSAAASIAFQVSLENANSELKLIADRMYRGKLHAAKLGKFGGGIFTPYGYGKNAMKELMVDPAESKVVQRIFEDVVNGLGTKVIANALNAEEIPTRSAIKSTEEVVNDGKDRKPVKVKPWTAEVVSQIVKNTLYKGLRKYKVQKEDEENGISAQYDFFPCVPAIVSSEVWEKANAAMKARATKPKNVRWLYLLDGIAQCGRCGKGYHAKYRAGGRVSYYMCYNRKFSKQKCVNAGVGIAELESAVWHMIAASKTVYENLLDSYPEGDEAKKILALEQERTALGRSIDDKKAQIQRSTKAWIKGRISEEENDLEIAKLEKVIKKQYSKISDINERIDVLKGRQVDDISLEDWVDQIETAHEDRFKVAEIIPGAVEKVIITSVNSSGNPPRFFLITVFYTRVDKPSTILFDKKTLESYYCGKGFNIKYDDNDILIGDVEEIHKKRMTNSEKEKVERIPFKPLNVFDSGKLTIDQNTRVRLLKRLKEARRVLTNLNEAQQSSG